MRGPKAPRRRRRLRPPKPDPVRARATSASAAAIALLGVLACGETAPPARGPSPQDAQAEDPARAREGARPAAPLPSLDDLAKRAAREAPLTREIARTMRLEQRGAGLVAAEVRAERDLCVRAFYAASEPARVYFAEAALGAGAGAAVSDDARVVPAAEGATPPGGPVCLHAGETAWLTVVGPGGDAGAVGEFRAVLVGSP